MSHSPGYEAVVDHLLAQKADPDQQDPRGRTPLFLAVADGANELCVSHMLKFAKNLNPHDNHGVTVLNLATRNNIVWAAKLLLAAGADPKHGDSFGGSAWDEAKDGGHAALRALFNITTIQTTPVGASEL